MSNCAPYLSCLHTVFLFMRQFSVIAEVAKILLLLMLLSGLLTCLQIHTKLLSLYVEKQKCQSALRMLLLHSTHTLPRPRCQRPPVLNEAQLDLCLVGQLLLKALDNVFSAFMWTETFFETVLVWTRFFLKNKGGKKLF